jgi:predicted ATPase/DNA-binding SARP family transcriptional activator
VHLAAGDRLLPIEVWPRRTARSLLLLLLATPGHRIGRERAVDLLWPNLAANRVSTTWYQALSTLRRVLEPNLPSRQGSSLLTVDATTIALADHLALAIDVDAFEEALHRVSAGSADDQRAALRSALALYQGELLAEEPAAEWATGRREELHLAWRRAILRLADLDLVAGEPLTTVPALQTVVTADPTAEEAHRALIRAFLTAGDRDEALRQYDRCRQALRDDLGIEPDDLTSALLVAGDAGERPGGSPRFTAPASPPHRPPTAPLTSLVGRDREIETVEDLLSCPDVRLVTLTGPGGVGKTRLATEMALRRDREGGRVVFVPLAGIRAPNLVLFAIAAALGIRNESARSPRAAVTRRIGQHELLLILDNFEHVAGAALEVAQLLASCPGLSVMTTSRIPLHLGSEHVVVVPPLALPGARRPSFAALARSDAVMLFVQRARAARADFTLTEHNAPTIARLCAQLDCLPLAIGLAAARVPLLSPQAILARLDGRLDLLADGPRDAPPRLRTMRNAIGWSHDLLGERERAVFRRLSVFAGGASLQAARWVTVDGHDASDPAVDPPLGTHAPLAVPESLIALIDHSLVQQEEQADGEPRFSMLETVRAYAMERLQVSGEAEATQRRHVAWLIAFAEAVLPCLDRTAQAVEVERVAPEIDNVRSALAWALAHGEASIALQLATATFQLWFVRAMPAEGRHWLEESLAASRDDPDLSRTDALLCAAALAFLQGDLERHVALAEESLSLARASTYQFGIAIALFQLGVAAEWRRDLDLAKARYDEALGLMRRLDEPYWVALILTNLGDVSLWRGRLSEAATLADEGLARWHELGNDWGIAQGQGTAAAVARQGGDHRRAATLYAESLARWAALGDRRGIAGTIAGLAGLAGSLGVPRHAARLLGAAYAIGAGVGVHNLAHHVDYERVVVATRAQLEERAFRDAWEAGATLSLEQAIAEAGIVGEMVTSRAAPAAEADATSAESAGFIQSVSDTTETAQQTNVISLRGRSRSPRRA